MTGRTRTPRTIPPRAATPGSAGDAVTLESLLATERELTELVSGANEEARRILEDAEARAATIESTAAGALAAGIAELEATTRSATERAVRDAEAAARVDIALFDGVPDDTIRGLAGELLRDFLHGEEDAP